MVGHAYYGQILLRLLEEWLNYFKEVAAKIRQAESMAHVPCTSAYARRSRHRVFIKLNSIFWDVRKVRMANYLL